MAHDGDGPVIGRPSTRLSDSTTQTLQPPRVLIVEDDPDVAASLCEHLASQGVSVLHSATGSTVPKLVEQLQPNLVLLDLRLPDADGFDVCRRLMNGEATAGVPIILLSGMEGAGLVRRARQAGARFFLRKPYDPDVLMLLVWDIVSGEW